MPAFTICNAVKDDAGLTLEELHAPECLKAIELAGAEPSQAVSTFELFDTDGDKVVTQEELLEVFLVNNSGEVRIC